jgi:isoaspartyl peptidase/L-asparaginase-like protein (Ntn-hydrolase superfamily)
MERMAENFSEYLPKANIENHDTIGMIALDESW